MPPPTSRPSDFYDLSRCGTGQILEYLRLAIDYVHEHCHDPPAHWDHRDWEYYSDDEEYCNDDEEWTGPATARDRDESQNQEVEVRMGAAAYRAARERNQGEDDMDDMDDMDVIEVLRRQINRLRIEISDVRHERQRPSQRFSNAIINHDWDQPSASNPVDDGVWYNDERPAEDHSTPNRLEEPVFSIEESDPFVNTTHDGVPTVWYHWQDMILWSLRGNVDEVRDEIQDFFRFEPPISREYIRERLFGTIERVSEHLTFLERYLPGEICTIRRARARLNTIREDINEQAVLDGGEPGDVAVSSTDSENSVTPPWPNENPPDRWNRDDDVELNILLRAGRPPGAFVGHLGSNIETAWISSERVNLEWLAIRMAQSLHLGITDREVALAIETQDIREMENSFVLEEENAFVSE
ncbi:MAG: hypothetical protein M1834_002036 [Cirrosporium novae-zelandiae]|nr:MAG: hypothetical protein M1834_002036 [Cirrosporium novae-zelandiae]